MTRRKYVLFILLVILVTGVIFQKQISTHFKIILFITQQFPQIPIKPLGLLTKPPTHQKVELESKNGKIVADLLIPQGDGKKGAVIIAMGIKTAEKDKPLLLKFADTMARLGLITFWPRLEALDKGVSLPEEPETFIESFKYLERFKDAKRISYVGFSVGSSVAMVAASDPNIADKVHSLVFFGGYFNVFDYYTSLATKTTKLDDQIITWIPSVDAVDHAKGLLETRKALEMVKIFEATSSAEAYDFLEKVPKEEIDGMRKYNPEDKIDDFQAEIFILHDKADTYVPYTESIRLNQALGDRTSEFLLIDLFEHVQPNRPLTWENILEIFKLYGFLHKVLGFL